MLFEEKEKLTSDECTNKACFTGKMFKYFEQIIKGKQKEGFKVIAGAEADGIWGSTPHMIKIAPAKTEDWSTVIPPKYQTECATCKDHHAFYLGREQNGHPKFGELCLDPKCLNKQKGIEPEPKKADRERSDYQHATGCRNRFLAVSLPARIGQSEVLRKRLVIYHLLERYKQFSGIQGVIGSRTAEQDRDKLMEQYSRKKHTDSYWMPEDIYRNVRNVPEKELDGLLYRLTMNMLMHTEARVLLNMTPEAGIDVNREFRMDEIFLGTKTKAELVAIVTKLKLGAIVSEKMKKPAILDEICKLDLTGKMVGSLKELCKVK